jgi:hypothetical protein
VRNTNASAPVSCRVANLKKGEYCQSWFDIV